VRRYLNREQCPDWRPGRATHSGMDAHREWIDARIAEGRINASELHGELASRGVRLSYATVRRYLTKRLGRAGQTRPRVNAAKPKPIPPPSAKHLSFDWIRRPEKRTAEAQGRLDKIRAAIPELTMALDLARISHPILSGSDCTPLWRFDPRHSRSHRTQPRSQRGFSPIRPLRHHTASVPRRFAAETARTPIVARIHPGVLLVQLLNEYSVQHLNITGRNRDRFACTRRNTSA
jgi:hypothetical protein